MITIPNRECFRCEEELMISPRQNPEGQENYLCGGCKVDIQKRINQIDRNAEPDVKAGKLKVMFRNIPSEIVPIEIQEMVEEVGDPEFLPEARIHCAGRIDHMTNKTSKGLELKKKYR